MTVWGRHTGRGVQLLVGTVALSWEGAGVVTLRDGTRGTAAGVGEMLGADSMDDVWSTLRDGSGLGGD